MASSMFKPGDRVRSTHNGFDVFTGAKGVVVTLEEAKKCEPARWRDVAVLDGYVVVLYDYAVLGYRLWQAYTTTLERCDGLLDV